ncbi:MAG: hypothetical protein LBI35_06735 [Burkholderiales bacterium]|jgi:hypothetical protein|nr:hypothetical protein [Burkholderiales bacterium]
MHYISVERPRQHEKVSPRRFLWQLDLRRLIPAGQRRQLTETDHPEMIRANGLVFIKTVLPKPATVFQNKHGNTAPLNIYSGCLFHDLIAFSAPHAQKRRTSISPYASSYFCAKRLFGFRLSRTVVRNIFLNAW